MTALALSSCLMHESGCVCGSVDSFLSAQSTSQHCKIQCVAAIKIKSKSEDGCRLLNRSVWSHRKMVSGFNLQNIWLMVKELENLSSHHEKHSVCQATRYACQPTACITCSLRYIQQAMAMMAPTVLHSELCLQMIRKVVVFYSTVLKKMTTGLKSTYPNIIFSAKHVWLKPPTWNSGLTLASDTWEPHLFLVTHGERERYLLHTALLFQILSLYRAKNARPMQRPFWYLSRAVCGSKLGCGLQVTKERKNVSLQHSRARLGA